MWPYWWGKGQTTHTSVEHSDQLQSHLSVTPTTIRICTGLQATILVILFIQPIQTVFIWTMGGIDQWKMVHQALSGHSPSYQADDCCLRPHHRCLPQKIVLGWHSDVSCQSDMQQQLSVQLYLKSTGIWWKTSNTQTCHTAVLDSWWRHFI